MKKTTTKTISVECYYFLQEVVIPKKNRTPDFDLESFLANFFYVHLNEPLLFTAIEGGKAVRYMFEINDALYEEVKTFVS